MQTDSLNTDLGKALTSAGTDIELAGIGSAAAKIVDKIAKYKAKN